MAWVMALSSWRMSWVLRAIAADAGVMYLPPLEVFCNKDGCLTRVGDDLVVFDEGHLTPAGSRLLMEASYSLLFSTPTAGVAPPRAPR